MRRGMVIAIALALVAASAAHGAPSTPAIAVAAEPTRPLFGDPFSYTVEVSVPAADAARARVDVPTGPFVRVAPTATSRSVANGVATITVTETLACLGDGCLPTSSARTVSLPAARVTIDGERVDAAPVDVRVGSRVTAQEVRASEPAFRRPGALPPRTTRFDPLLAEVVLAILGTLLLVAGVATLAAPLWRRRSHGAAATVDPVARAARLLRESAGREASDRRRAAGLAARVVPDRALALDAATVAWSRPEPAPPDATGLADRVEHVGGGRR